MPAYQLGLRKARRFEVVGSYSGAATTVAHVGLLARPHELAAATEVAVFDMGPPLRLELEPPATMTADAVGWLPLTNDEEESLDLWIADMRTRVSGCQYIANPAEEPIVDTISGTLKGWKFSCAGFVRKAYAEGAGVEVLESDPETLPLLDFETILRVWGHIEVGRDRTPISRVPQDIARRMLASQGIAGPGPWRILVPGYLLHALRTTGRLQLPYKPSEADISFAVKPPIRVRVLLTVRRIEKKARMVLSNALQRVFGSPRPLAPGL